MDYNKTIARAMGQEIGDLVNAELVKIYPPCFYDRRFLKILAEKLEIESDGEEISEFVSCALQQSHDEWKLIQPAKERG